MTTASHREAARPARQAGAGYTWQPRPFNIWVALPPLSPLQEHILRQMQQRLEAQGCLFIDPPDQPTPLGPVTHLAVGFAPRHDDEISPLDFLSLMPKPRGMGLAVATIDRIPESGLFDLARGLLVRRSGHVGVLFEGDPDQPVVRRALWASMAGNYQLIQGDESAIFDSVVLRLLAHIGAEKLTGHEGDDPGRLTWEAWCASPIHAEMAEAARRLGEAGIIEDQVPLEQYGSLRQVGSVLSFLNRSALGEGMRSQFDPALGVMGITTTGGGKINLSADPLDGQIVPVVSLTAKGYIRALPQGCPITFNAPSVETHENGMIYLASALARAGLASSFDSFLGYLDDHFARHDTIDILPEGLEPGVLTVDHFHRQPKAGSIRNPEQVEIVYPDHDRFPPIDFPCGVRDAEYHLLSALFEAEAFRSPGPLDRVVLAVLPGHGAVAVSGGSRPALTDLLINGMEMEEVARV